MLPNSTLCFKAVGSPCCKSTFIKYGKSPQGKQRYRCTSCGITQVATYTNKAYQKNTKPKNLAQITWSERISHFARTLNVYIEKRLDIVAQQPCSQLVLKCICGRKA